MNLLMLSRSMFFPLALACVLLSGALAGCLNNETGVKGPRWMTPLPEEGSLKFLLPTEPFRPCTAVGCLGSGQGHEPSVAATPSGILVADARGQVARSVDGGQNFITVIPPHGTNLGQWHPLDAIVQADPDGRTWYSMLQADRFGADPKILGIQIYRTPDAGLTWDLAVSITVPWPTVDEPDRPWLAFKDGRVLLSFQRSEPNPGGYAMISQDDGETWNGPFKTSPQGQHGRPAWSGEKFLVPYVIPSGPSQGAWVATSPDGQEWKQMRVREDPTTYGPPVIATGPDGTTMAWVAGGTNDGQWNLVGATTADHGTTWSAATLLSGPGEEVVVGPWVLADDAGTHVAYYACCNVSLRVATIQDDVATRGVAASIDRDDRPYTGFAHMAAYEGRLMIVYPDATGKVFFTRST